MTSIDRLPNFSNSCDCEVEIDSLDGGRNDEHNDITLVEITKTFEPLEFFFLWNRTILNDLS